jgi:hypothetical protein
MEWQIQVNNPKIHIMEFNKSLINPLIIKGWIELRTTYNLQGYQRVFFNYMGDNFFKISFDSKESKPNVFPPFHSLSTAPKFHISFQVTLQRHTSLYKPLVMHFIILYHFILNFTLILYLTH